MDRLFKRCRCKGRRLPALLTQLLMLSTFFLVCLPANATAKSEFITLGTGGANGVYYPLGGALCYFINQMPRDHKVHCEIKSTPGSIYNLTAIKNGEIDLALVQSDWQYHAYNGSAKFAFEGELSELRALFSLHAEPFTILARADANINTFDELAGKRVNIGEPNSGQRATMDMLLAHYQWDYSNFSSVTSLAPIAQAQALCDNKVDAIIFVAGHPNSSIREASRACDTRLVEVKGGAVSELMKQHRYYHYAVIPAKMYRGTDQKIETFGVGATLVTTSSLPDDIAYDLVKSVFMSYQKLIQLHPAFAHLTKQMMVSQYLSAPIHPGALRYYREQGLLGIK